jgi:predicted DNA-binding transcriptional regulator AlpA
MTSTTVTQTAPTKLYRVHAVMEQLSVSRTTVYRLVNSGKLKAS